MLLWSGCNTSWFSHSWLNKSLTHDHLKNHTKGKKPLQSCLSQLNCSETGESYYTLQRLLESAGRGWCWGSGENSARLLSCHLEKLHFPPYPFRGHPCEISLEPKWHGLNLFPLEDAGVLSPSTCECTSLEIGSLQVVKLGWVIRVGFHPIGLYPYKREIWTQR